MPNPYGVPDISVQDVARKRTNGETFILLDVREAHELNFADLGDDVLLAPISEIARRYADALPEEITADKNVEIVVFCHHGSRSAQVASFLLQNGWTNVLNMEGGINAYANEVDSSVGQY